MYYAHTATANPHFKACLAGHAAADGVHCHDADGSLIGKIMIPEMVANVTFGGAKLNRLFICGTTSLYSIYVTANGSKPG